ncbi:MAG: cell division protein FtsL [Maritimibacter sp.]|nr:cell division protein FtsL [Maritimibacter sp.]
MRVIVYVFATLAVIGLGYWAYVENYRTQASLDQVERLQGEIGRMREELGVLRAEWAYLNRPDRLRDLAEMNFDRLKLFPLAPEQFGDVATIPYPMPDMAGPDGLLDGLDVSGAVDVKAEASQ